MELPVRPFGGAPALLDRAERSVRRARALLSELGQSSALGPDLDLDHQSAEAVWRLAALAPLSPLDSQRLLEIDDPAERLAELVMLVDAVSGDLAQLLADGQKAAD